MVANGFSTLFAVGPRLLRGLYITRSRVDCIMERRQEEEEIHVASPKEVAESFGLRFLEKEILLAKPRNSIV